MDEFVGRMATQRHVLHVVNSKFATREKLFGLSASSIDRWIVANQLGPQSKLAALLKVVSSELFFMATRSQEPVSSEYESRRSRILEAVAALEKSVSDEMQNGVRLE